jgi:hypothetical protein
VEIMQWNVIKRYISLENQTSVSIPILPAEKEKNFFDLAQILGPLPKAWPGGAACSVDRSGEEDSQNRPFLATYGSAFLEPRRTTSASGGLPLDESQNSSHNQNLKTSGC